MATYFEIFTLFCDKFKKESLEFIAEEPHYRLDIENFEGFLWKALDMNALLELFCFEGTFEAFAIRCEGSPASDVFVDLKELTLTYSEGFYLGKVKPIRSGVWYGHFFGSAPFEKILERLAFPLYEGKTNELKPHCVEIFSKHFRRGGSFRELVKKMQFNKGELVLNGVVYA